MANEEDEVKCLLQRHRTSIIRDLNETNLLSILVKSDVLNVCDEEIINGGSEISENDTNDLEVKCNKLIDIISKNGFEKFKVFCYAIETECPQLITELINDRLNNGKTRDKM